MTIANFSVTGYINTRALPELQGSIEGLLYWYEGLANWASLSKVLLLPKDTALYLAGMWRNGGAEPISGHLELVITRPDGSQLALNDVLNQNNWAAPGNGWMVQFEPVVLDQLDTYKATLRLSTMGQLLDETSMDVAIAAAAFTYQVTACYLAAAYQAPAWRTPKVTVRIGNPGSQAATRTVTYRNAYVSGTAYEYSESWSITIPAGGFLDWEYVDTYVRIIAGQPYTSSKTYVGGDGVIDVWLEDDAGGKSAVYRLPAQAFGG